MLVMILVNILVERIKAKSHDGRMVPISLIRLKESKQDGKSKILLYAYGAYKHSISPSLVPLDFV